MVMPSPVRSETPSSVSPSASFAMGRPRAPHPVESMDSAVVHRLCGVHCPMIFHRYYCYFSSDSNVSVLKLKTRGGKRRENHPVQ